MDRIKSILFIALTFILIVAFAALYYLDSTEPVDIDIYAEAEATLKTLDATKEEVRRCTWPLSFVKLSEQSQQDEIALKTECDSKLVVYKQNMEKYKSLFKTIKNSEKTRLQKWLDKDKEISTGYFDLNYSPNMPPSE